jgi:uncharacterized protein YraI
VRRGAAARAGLIAGLVALAAPGAWAATVAIEEAAVQVRVAGPGVTRAVVRVTNPGPGRQALDLRLAVWWEHTRPRRADRFATGLTLEPGESRRVSLPVVAYPGGTR